MTEIDYITIRGFKSISYVNHLAFGPVTVLIGPNGSGKSNFVEVFSFLNAIRDGRLQEYVIKAGGADRVLHFGSRRTKSMQIHISFEGGVNQYEIELAPNEIDELIPHSEALYFWDQKQHSKPYDRFLARMGKEAGISSPQATAMQRHVRRHLESWRLYHFHDTSGTSPMKATAAVEDNRYLRADGSNLSAFLYLLSKMHEDSYRLIVQTVRQVAPFFADFNLAPQRLNPARIRLEWEHVGTDTYFDAASLSDGTLRFLALATLFLQPLEFRPSVILVDEPELGLHPYAISLLAAMIRHVSVETQVILATQSSLLLDHFEPEEILVAEHVDGATQFVRLETERLDAWLENYSLGQLWEKNELRGRPVQG